MEKEKKKQKHQQEDDDDEKNVLDAFLWLVYGIAVVHRKEDERDPWMEEKRT